MGIDAKMFRHRADLTGHRILLANRRSQSMLGACNKKDEVVNSTTATRSVT